MRAIYLSFRIAESQTPTTARQGPTVHAFRRLWDFKRLFGYRCHWIAYDISHLALPESFRFDPIESQCSLVAQMMLLADA